VEKKFTSDEVPLAQLLQQARVGVLQLPDFQRSWVWDDGHIASLLASISLSYPIGVVMTLQTGNPDVRFRPRPLQGVQLDAAVEPEYMLLDGQQRATSLYLALMSGKPVPTRDERGKELLRWYYADIAGCLDPETDREDAIRSVPEDRLVKTFQGHIALDLSTTEKEIAAGMFPLAIVLDYSEAMAWQLAYLQSAPGEHDQRLETWRGFAEGIVNAFVQYQVPTIQLVKATPKEAVCQVFEKVNTGGVSLTVFELLTATYAADDFNLREDWDERRALFDQHSILDRVEATDFIQIVTLLATYDRRRAHLGTYPGDDKAPAVSCKRRDMLRLSLTDYQQWADVASKALARVVPLLHSEHIFAARDIPYDTQLVPLAAVFAILGDKAQSQGVRVKLARWYWCGVFGEMYGGSTETRFALDLTDVVAWVGDDLEEPRTIRDAQFQAERLLTLRTRNAAAYKGLYALQMKRGARDFRTGHTIDVHAYVDDAIDVHHIFPQRWCVTNEIPDGYANSVVNKTPIDAHTNRWIGGHAPSKYLTTIETKAEVATAQLDAILRSHEIDPVAMRQDDFASFFNQRFERLLRLIETAMGKPVNRSPDGDDSPFMDPEREAELVRDGVVTLLKKGESKVVEFKSTARKNLHTGDKDSKIEWSAIKTLAGFMNAFGGTLVIGVGDHGEIIGIDEDFPFLKKQDCDGWELWLTDAASHTLGKAAAADLDVRIAVVDGKYVARVDTGPSAEPVFARPSSSPDKPVFLVRINNSTQELSGQDALTYQKSRWAS
jgi:hypothetical protein